MKHDGLRASPRRLFGYAAAEMCVDICQELVAAIEANPNVPEETGQMKHGFFVESHHGGAMVINPGAPYWAFVEFGHDVVDETGQVIGHAPAHPFARPAWEEIRARHAA